MLPILYILKSWHKNSGGLVAEQLSVTYGENKINYLCLFTNLWKKVLCIS